MFEPDVNQQWAEGLEFCETIVTLRQHTSPHIILSVQNPTDHDLLLAGKMFIGTVQPPSEPEEEPEEERREVNPEITNADETAQTMIEFSPQQEGNAMDEEQPVGQPDDVADAHAALGERNGEGEQGYRWPRRGRRYPKTFTYDYL
ncbi:uncharacterized protein LOC110004405 isoform X1 [Tachysurus ichikawai]